MKQVIKLLSKITKSNFTDLNVPYKLNFCCTLNCQSRCKTCNIWKVKPVNELNIEEIKKFFQKNNFFSWVDITGGEIFLHPDIDEIFKIIIEECKDMYLFHYVTNGLMPKKIIDSTKKLMKLNPKRVIITVSLDGPEEVHDNLRGIKGNFIKAIETYKGLSEIPKVEVYFGTTISKYNLGTFNSLIVDVQKYIPKANISNFHVNIADESDRYYTKKGENLNESANKKILENLKEVMKMKGIPFSPIQIIEWTYMRNVEKYFKTKKMPYKCQAINTSCYIDSYGNVFPCITYSKNLGNLRDFNYDLRKVYKSQNIKQIISDIRNHKCPDCWTPCDAYQAIYGSLFNVATFQ